MYTNRTHRRPAVTPIQLIVLLGLLLLAIGFLAPAVARIREAAARTQSSNNLKQLGLAMHNAHDVFNMFPPTVGEFNNKTGSLHFFALPFIEQDNLFKLATNDVWDNDVWSKQIPIFIDPRDKSMPAGELYKNWLATTSYAANYMVFKDGNMKITQITDGTSNTLMFATRYQLCGETPTAWGYPSLYTWAPMTAHYNTTLFQVAPRPDDCDPTRAQAIGGVMQIGMCDGSVRSVSSRLSASTWANVCDPNDGNVLGDDF
jgi:hypothetical protein